MIKKSDRGCYNCSHLEVCKFNENLSDCLGKIPFIDGRETYWGFLRKLEKACKFWALNTKVIGIK